MDTGELLYQKQIAHIYSTQEVMLFVKFLKDEMIQKILIVVMRNVQEKKFEEKEMQERLRELIRNSEPFKYVNPEYLSFPIDILENELITQILSLIKEEMPKKMEDSKLPLGNSYYDGRVDGWNEYRDEMLKKMEGGDKNE